MRKQIKKFLITANLRIVFYDNGWFEFQTDSGRVLYRDLLSVDGETEIRKIIGW